ncbi:hypothetical protein SAMN05443245_5230 [Paraburkholderia fungorum]|uniref:Uncharacterized protein n=1 Tax=Paraburkholderia fungorum TaxID=134537 RepID=A0A1H1IIK7_9BURK|nr:hypothetical protein [Paraburkholderia fungorum]SDR37484.1 hypothetical protein SAMN05443245_5230 [Paraburkholderia fungorum]
MINIGVLLVGFVLGVFALGLLVFLVVLHKPRPAAPTLRRRKDKPVQIVPDAEVSGINYQWLGVTGSEQE